MYLFVNKTKNNKTAKGIKKNIIKGVIDNSNYLDCLQNNAIMHHKMKTIRSEYHQISSYQINKVSLSCHDDKRYILDDGITSLAYGHYLKKLKNNLNLYGKRKRTIQQKL